MALHKQQLRGTEKKETAVRNRAPLQVGLVNLERVPASPVSHSEHPSSSPVSVTKGRCCWSTITNHHRGCVERGLGLVIARLFRRK